MFKTLFLTAALAGMAPAAEAGGLDLQLFLGGHNSPRISVGVGTHGVVRSHRFVQTHRSVRRSHARPVHRVWTPAYSERVSHRVWVPARYEHVVVPARYEYREVHHGQHQRVLVRRSYTKRHRVAGYYQTRYRTVRHAGRYQTRSRARHASRRRSRAGH